MPPVALAISHVLNFVPQLLWPKLKSLFNVTNSNTKVCDIHFEVCAKYTAGLLLVMGCLSFANEFVRNVDIDCASTGTNSYVIVGQHAIPEVHKEELNTFCWNQDTFLVAKALLPERRGATAYPGVSDFDEGTDEIIRQSYYKQVWFVLGVLGAMSYLPYVLWKYAAVGKIFPLVNPDEDFEIKASLYFNTMDTNGGFAGSYFLLKLIMFVSPVLQWFYLVGFIGKKYKTYGLDVLNSQMLVGGNEPSAWPSPMDALFPKMSMCNWNNFGYGGDIEKISAICQLPLNNINQWTFFIYWFWLVIIFLLSAFSMVKYLLLLIILPYRHSIYENVVRRLERQDPELGTLKSKVLYCLSFGELVRLSLIKRNMDERDFRDFIRLVITMSEDDNNSDIIRNYPPPTKSISDPIKPVPNKQNVQIPMHQINTHPNPIPTMDRSPRKGRRSNSKDPTSSTAGPQVASIFGSGVPAAAAPIDYSSGAYAYSSSSYKPSSHSSTTHHHKSSSSKRRGGDGGNGGVTSARHETPKAYDNRTYEEECWEEDDDVPINTSTPYRKKGSSGSHKTYASSTTTTHSVPNVHSGSGAAGGVYVTSTSGGGGTVHHQPQAQQPQAQSSQQSILGSMLNAPMTATTANPYLGYDLGAYMQTGAHPYMELLKMYGNMMGAAPATGTSTKR